MSHSPLLEENNSPLYVRVSNRLRAWIDEGVYLPGSRIPSVREMSAQMKVSVSTVLQSYDLLESKGVIEARPQSGFYVKLQTVDKDKAIRTNPKSGPRFVQSHDTFLNVIRSCGDPDLVPLGGAVIHWSLLPTDTLQRTLVRVAREQGPLCMKYERGAGYWPLRKEIAQRSIQMGCDFQAESVVVTNGCMEAINLCLKSVTQAGDTVAVESPTYYGILRAIESLGLKILELPASSQSGLDLECFEEKLKLFSVKAAIITPSFLNPLGSLMPDQDKQKLVQICARHDVALIEDDIYAELKFEGSRPLALKSFDKKDQVFFCSSFSKTLSPGYRVGWVIPPKKYMERIEILKSSLSVATNTAAQMAIAHHLADHNHERHLRKLRQTLAQNIHLFSQKIEMSFPEGTKMTRPQGGCLLWVEFPPQISALMLHQQALKEKISLIPGPVFSAGGKYQNCIRLNCGNPWDPMIEKSLIRIGIMAQEMIK